MISETWYLIPPVKHKHHRQLDIHVIRMGTNVISIQHHDHRLCKLSLSIYRWFIPFVLFGGRVSSHIASPFIGTYTQRHTRACVGTHTHKCTHNCIYMYMNTCILFVKINTRNANQWWRVVIATIDVYICIKGFCPGHSVIEYIHICVCVFVCVCVTYPLEHKNSMWKNTVQCIHYDFIILGIAAQYQMSFYFQKKYYAFICLYFASIHHRCHGLVFMSCNKHTNTENMGA